VAKDMLSLVVTSGTGVAAQVGDEVIWGKTGTTENYGDAWFVGSNDDLTVAVWVGYADRVQPMEYEYAGSPVAGGTYPAAIFADFMSTWVELRAARGLDRDDEDDDTGDGSVLPVDPGALPESEQALPAEPAVPETPQDTPQAEPQPNVPAEPPAPQTPAPVDPAPPVAPPPSGGGGSGGGVTPGGEGTTG